MPSKPEQPNRKKDREGQERPGETPPSKVDRDPNDIARFERPFERFEDLEDWQQPLRIDDDRESEESEDRVAHDRLWVRPGAGGQRGERRPGQAGPIPNRSGSRTS